MQQAPNLGDANPRAYTRAAREGVQPSLDREFIEGFYRTWADLEERINQLQETKKNMLGKVRSVHGRHEAEALKLAMRLIAMSDRERAESTVFDRLARHYVGLLNGEVIDLETE